MVSLEANKENYFKEEAKGPKWVSRRPQPPWPHTQKNKTQKTNQQKTTIRQRSMNQNSSGRAQGST